MSKDTQIVILQDTKEKTPWDFTIYKDVKGQVKKGLKTGDYTVRGYESLICLERKKSTGEICTNLGTKYTQFRAEFDRMQAFELRCVICEFPAYNILDFPRNSGIPQRKWKWLRINGKFLYKRFFELSEEYAVPLYFTNNSTEAQELAIRLIREKICQENN